jgi:hypothetical protein
MRYETIGENVPVCWNLNWFIKCLGLMNLSTLR